MLHPELGDVFRQLGEAEIGWCVVRLPPDPGKTGGDVDLLMDPAHTIRLRPLLARCGFVELRSWPGGLHFLKYDRASDRWLWLHFVTDLSFGPGGVLHTHTGAGCLARRLSRGAVTSLAAGDELWALLLHCLLDKQAIAPRHRVRLAALASGTQTDSPLRKHLAAICPPDWSPRRVLECVRRDDWGSLERLGPTLVALAKHRRRKRVHERLQPFAARVIHGVSGAHSRRGLAVALLGPDGAGKSTLIAGIQDSFIFPVRPIYMGLTGGLLRYVDRLRLPLLVVVGRLLVFWGRYTMAQYHQLRGRLVVFDRYTYDSAVPTPHSLNWLGRLYRCIDGYACPSPDLVLLLDAPGEVMHARKGEYTPEMLEDWRQHFLDLRQRVRRLQVMDATLPAATVRADAIERIWCCYAARWQPAEYTIR